ncbi:MAG: lytic murein transglycosylase [Hyphomicrobiaceae bacterium]
MVKRMGMVLVLAVPAASGLMAEEAALPRAPWDALLAAVQSEAEKKGVSRATFERAAANLAPDPEVLALTQRQPEHTRSVGDYLATLVSAERIEEGSRKLAENETTLASLETRYGVDRHILVAIWGVESKFGATMGVRGTIRSLATLAAYDTRRGSFWRSELLAALQILQRGDTTPDRLTGSWAGAMGHTQFMPTTYQTYAVDFDRDGRRDIWGTVADALASTGNYLKASGWRTGEPWGFEIVLPSGFDVALSAPGNAKRAADWQALGAAVPAGRSWPRTDGELRLLLPAGHRGPAFLASRNFRAILRYNPAVAYALAVGHLADRFAGRPPFAVPWPDSDRPLARAEREEVQRRLAARGLNTGGVDGILGTETQAAIRSYQKNVGLPQDGHPSYEVLERLRHEDSNKQ